TRNEIDAFFIEKVFPLLCLFNIIDKKKLGKTLIVEISDRARTDKARSSSHDNERLSGRFGWHKTPHQNRISNSKASSHDEVRELTYTARDSKICYAEVEDALDLKHPYITRHFKLISSRS